MTASIYRPLNSDKDEIRLLKIKPAPWLESEVVCSLFTTSLSTQPVFDALSYCWGDANVTKPIILEGVPQPVTVNLEAALRYLRRSDQAIVLWADAVCINQSDLAERSSQVSLMGRIYSSAMIVRIWMGEAADNSDEVMQIIRKISRGYPEAEDKSAFMHSCSLQGLCVIQNYVSEQTFILECERSFARRPWWFRVWVMQEALLAREAVMHCGSQQISFKDLMDLYEIWIDLKSISFALYEGFRLTFVALFIRLFPFQWLRRRQRLKPSLGSERMVLQVLSYGRLLQATDTRDKIYGLLGLLSDPRYQVRPKYDWSMEKVYTGHCLQLMIASGSLSALDYASSKKSPGSQLASWVPDWSFDDGTGNMVSQTIFSDFFNACGGTPLSLDPLLPATIRLSGVSIGAISLVGHKLDLSELSDERRLGQYQVYQSWLRLWGYTSIDDDRMSASYAAGGSSRTAFWQTITHCITIEADTFHSMACRTGDTDFPLFQRWWKWISTEEEDPSRHQHQDHQMLNLQDIIPIMNDRSRFLVLQNGCIGIGVEDARKDDIVYVLAGGKQAYVLRPVDSAPWQPAFTFIGVCYVHGFMNGEATRPEPAMQRQQDSSTIWEWLKQKIYPLRAHKDQAQQAQQANGWHDVYLI